MARIIKARVFRNIGTEAEWLARNPVLLDGEVAQVRFGSRIREKVGDGSKTFSQLSYQDGELKVSKVTPSFPFVSGEGPAPEGIYMAGESGVYNGVTVDVTGKIVFLLWDGVNKLEVVETELPQTEIVNDATTGGADAAWSAEQGKILNEKIFDGEIAEVPKGRMSETFTSRLSPLYSYYDSRCLVEDKTTLESVNVLVSTGTGYGGGTIELLALNPTTKATVHAEQKTVQKGLNVLQFSNTTALPDSFIAGFRIITETGVRTRQEANSFSFWKKDGDTSYAPIGAGAGYILAYSINTLDQSLSLSGKIATLEILVKGVTSNLQDAINNNSLIRLEPKEYQIEEQINIPDGKFVEGIFGKSVIAKATGFTGSLFRVEGSQDVSIKGIRFKGDLPNYAYSMNGINNGVNIVESEDDAYNQLYKGDVNGLMVKSSERVVLEALQFHNLSGSGMIGDLTGKTYIHGLKASSLFFFNCYNGLEAINEHEFSNYSDIMASLCQIGVKVSSGNLNIANNIITRCRVGAMFTEGLNNAHGIMSNSEIKHHQVAGLLVKNVGNGQLFTGLQMQYANLSIRDSRGVLIPELFFTNGAINCSGNHSGGGANEITNLWKFGTPSINNTGNLVIKNQTSWNA